MTSTPDFRCSRASVTDGEPMAGTAPTETRFLLVEYAGPWGRQAVAESRLPEQVREHLAGLDGVRVQLIRRPGGRGDGGVRVFAASLGDAPVVTTAVLDDVGRLLELRPADLVPYAGPLWLVCTNGRRDLCCAETGRPVASALAGRWPEATWETTHLGGHRFAGTLLALPSGVTLGRLDPGTAVEDCALLEQGLLPTRHARGRAGLTGPEQVADLHLRAELGLDRVDDVRVHAVTGDTVRLTARRTAYDVTVAQRPGEPRRQSCADLVTKPGTVFEVTAVGTPTSMAQGGVEPPSSPHNTVSTTYQEDR